MEDARVEFLEMELRWVRAIRRGRELALVGPALARENEIEAELARLRSGQNNVVAMAAGFARRDTDPDQGAPAPAQG